VETPANSAQKSGSLMQYLKEFLSTPEKPVTSAEFREFWTSCSREEKDEFTLQAQNLKD
jgi:hypothetical protein